MFEARLTQGSLLKKLIESIRELVTDANFDVSSSGLSLQVRAIPRPCPGILPRPFSFLAIFSSTGRVPGERGREGWGLARPETDLATLRRRPWIPRTFHSCRS